MPPQALADSLVSSTIWVRDAALAQQLVPELAADAPPLLGVGGAGDDTGYVPVLGAERILTPLAELLVTVGQELKSGRPAASVEALSAEALAADPLVGALAEALSSCAVVGLQRVAVPGLVVAWGASRLLAAHDCGVVRISPARMSDLDSLSRWLRGLDPAKRATAVTALSWEVAGRMAAAIRIASESAPAVASNQLLRRLVTDPLLLSAPAGAIHESLDHAFVGAVLDTGGDVQAFAWVPAAVGAAIEASQGRRGRAGKANAADAGLAEVLRKVNDTSRAVFHPTVAAYAIASLPELVTAKELKAAGIPDEVARLMVKRPSALALAAAWGDVLGPMLTWDVLAALVDRLVPLVVGSSGDLTGGRGPLPQGEGLRLLVPRADPDEDLHVVATRLSELQAGLTAGAGVEASGAAARMWREAAGRSGAEAQSLVGDHGVAVFRTADAAARFGLSIQAALSGARTVEVGARGRRVQLTDDHSTCVGLASGRVRGGADGERCVLAGPAVGDAIGLTGLGGGPVTAPGDVLGLRRAGASPIGFANGGILASGPFFHTLLQELGASRATLREQGGSGSAGGVGQDFAVYPAVAWWERGDGVVLAIALTDPPGQRPAVELQQLSAAEFMQVFEGDRDAAAMSQASAAAAESSGPAIDPFDSTQGYRPATPVDDAPEGQSSAGGMAKVDSVFGFVAPTAAQPAPADPGPEPSETAVDAAAEAPADGPDVVPGPEAEAAAPAPAVGRLALLEEDPPTSPTVGPPMLAGDASPFEQTASAASVVDIEDDWEEGDSWQGEEADVAADAAPTGGDPAAPEFGFLGDQLGGAELDAPVESSAGSPSPAFSSSDFSPESDGEAPSAAMDDGGGGAGDSFVGAAPPAANPGPPADPFDQQDGPGFSFMGGSAPSAPDAFAGEDASDADSFGFSMPSEPDDEPEDDGGGFSFAALDEAPEEGGRGPSDGDAGGQGFGFVEGAATEDIEDAPTDVAAPPAAVASTGDPLLDEIIRMFKAHVVVADGDAFIFGVREGGQLRDANRFETSGRLDRAYARFLQQKIRSGFVMEAHKTAPLRPGLTAATLDATALMEAYKEVAR